MHLCHLFLRPETPAACYATTRARTLLPLALALVLAESHCAGTVLVTGRGAEPMCRGAAVQKAVVAITVEETVTQCPSHSRVPCLANMVAPRRRACSMLRRSRPNSI